MTGWMGGPVAWAQKPEVWGQRIFLLVPFPFRFRDRRELPCHYLGGGVNFIVLTVSMQLDNTSMLATDYGRRSPTSLETSRTICGCVQLSRGLASCLALDKRSFQMAGHLPLSRQLRSGWCGACQGESWLFRVEQPRQSSKTLTRGKRRHQLIIRGKLPLRQE